MHVDFLASDFRSECGFQFCLQFSQIADLYPWVERGVGVRRNPAKARDAFGVLDGWRAVEGHRVRDIDRHRRSRTLKDSHFLESGLNRKSELSDFSFVDLRRGVKHDKKGKQEGDEIGVRDQPALVIGVTGASPAAIHALDTSGTTAVGLRASVRNPS